uniref:Uncharacterized protein n=1 Tax=Lactuca sativa TaxID=4236 RepID=A0A9R1WJR1_LACSA|nr:hypothetical protein LSAT_V11C200059540 [Lactuca sativa]
MDGIADEVYWRKANEILLEFLSAREGGVEFHWNSQNCTISSKIFLHELPNRSTPRLLLSTHYSCPIKSLSANDPPLCKAAAVSQCAQILEKNGSDNIDKSSRL